MARPSARGRGDEGWGDALTGSAGLGAPVGESRSLGACEGTTQPPEPYWQLSFVAGIARSAGVSRSTCTLHLHARSFTVRSVLRSGGLGSPGSVVLGTGLPMAEP